MQASSENGKLFIGGISWDTNEDRLRDYFGSFGEVVEAVIMKDRATGRARGFGFVVFADGAVAERVTQEKHNIDGRMVEAKKAVPKDDQNILHRTTSGIIQYGSPSPGRTRKIFVGGLASTVTEADFRNYFEQFGTITDVVVMYDHNTQRPRGFGFITYDSEEAVDKVLHLKTFHELNGKMVEVKRAVPKELSPAGPSRGTSPLNNYGLGRVSSSFLTGYNQGYNPGTVGYGLRMDHGGRFSPVVASRSGYGPNFGSGYGMGLNFEPGLSQAAYGGSGGNFNGGFRGMMNHHPYYIESTNRFSNPIGYDNAGSNNGGNTSFFSSVTRNMWGNGGITNSAGLDDAYVGHGNTFGNRSINWGDEVNNNAPNNSLNFSYGGGENSFSLGPSTGGYGGGRSSSGNNSVINPTASSGGGFDGGLIADHLYVGGGGGSEDYGEPAWRDGGLPLGSNNTTSDVAVKSPSPGFVGGYSVNKRQTTRGIAT
ncbi:unnamed protein product [Linum trigynum]|uniref:RRM domain-containing protein n=1 Tax=Linum trigynum TaxID=586398 RepID=A0AAV2E7R0_9ROSI